METLEKRNYQRCNIRKFPGTDLHMPNAIHEERPIPGFILDQSSEN